MRFVLQGAQGMRRASGGVFAFEHFALRRNSRPISSKKFSNFFRFFWLTVFFSSFKIFASELPRHHWRGFYFFGQEKEKQQKKIIF